MHAERAWTSPLLTTLTGAVRPVIDSLGRAWYLSRQWAQMTRDDLALVDGPIDAVAARIALEGAPAMARVQYRRALDRGRRLAEAEYAMRLAWLTEHVD